MNGHFTFNVNVGDETQHSVQIFLLIYLISWLILILRNHLKIGDEISGHFVYGHVDRTTKN